MKELRYLEFSKKRKRPSETRSRGYEDFQVKEGYLVYYQHQDKKGWLGPVKVFVIKELEIIKLDI